MLYFSEMCCNKLAHAIDINKNKIVHFTRTKIKKSTTTSPWEMGPLK